MKSENLARPDKVPRVMVITCVNQCDAGQKQRKRPNDYNGGNRHVNRYFTPEILRDYESLRLYDEIYESEIRANTMSGVRETHVTPCIIWEGKYRLSTKKRVQYI
jgi:hypothetical protein